MIASKPKYPGIRVITNGNQLVSLHTEARYFDYTHFTDALMTDQEVKELPKVWRVGGDGGMGDIGFQNVSKVVLQNRPNVKLLMLDTQVYSNTGGQNSDHSPMAGGFDMTPSAEALPTLEEIAAKQIASLQRMGNDFRREARRSAWMPPTFSGSIKVFTAAGDKRGGAQRECLEKGADDAAGCGPRGRRRSSRSCLADGAGGPCRSAARNRKRRSSARCAGVPKA